MNPEQIQQIIDTLLKTGEFVATKTFELAVRQAIVEGAISSVAGFSALVVGILGALSTREYWSKRSSDTWEDIRQAFFYMAIFFGGIMTLSGIQYLLNPEWYALKLLLTTVGIGVE